jgi:predicted phage baseplate assembly protein
VICRLPEVPLAYKQTIPGGDFPPVSTLEVTVETSGGGGDVWDEVPNFIHSDDSSENGDHFVVETDENRRSIIRFGNGRNGRELPDGAKVTCTYQYGMPLEGNVGADKIVNFNAATVAGDPALPVILLRSCRNPFDVTNGIDREPIAEIIRRVPEAYRYRQLRAVTLADYVARAEEIAGVSRAAARYGWTGSWRTVRVTIDPVGTTELSYKLRKTVASYLNAVRLIGEDLEIRPPVLVPLEINVMLCANSDVWPEDIRFVLEEEFSAGWTPDGRKGFFHPDEWTFGQALYASQIIGRAIKVKGVEHAVGQKTSVGGVEKTISVSIKRWNAPFAATDSLTQLNFNEIILVMSDPDHMEHGFIRFDVKGGRQ